VHACTHASRIRTILLVVVARVLSTSNLFVWQARTMHNHAHQSRTAPVDFLDV
jgi:hypothetical protein